MDDYLQAAFYNNRAIRGSEGTEGGTLSNTEHGLTAFLNHYVGSGNVIYVDRAFEHKHKPLEVLRAPNPGHPIVVQIVRDRRTIVFSKREMRDFLHKREIQARQVFNGLLKYYKAKEIRGTLGAGTAHSQSQELCFEIHVPLHQSHILSEMVLAQGPPSPSA
jgi:hypothetical protein